MTKAKAQPAPESTSAFRRRMQGRLIAAYVARQEPLYLARTQALARWRELHTIVRAVIPGKQTDQNTRTALEAATKAVCRLLRRRARR